MTPARIGLVAAALALGLMTVGQARQTMNGIRTPPMFRDITTEAGIRFKHQRALFDPRLSKVMTWVTSINAGACTSDYDNDGDPDFYNLTSKQGSPNALLRNDGKGRFEDVAAASGAADMNTEESLSMACLFADLDNDGDADLFIASYGRNRLLMNDGAGRFTETGLKANLKEMGNSSSVLALDFDRDGWLDLMVGRYFPENMRQLTTTFAFPSTFETARNGAPNLLYRNNRDGTFTEVARTLRVDDPGWTLALGAGDLDDDGDPDVYLANDFGPDVVYRNNGDGTFADVTRQSIGVDGDAGMNVDIADYDNDGKLDIYVTNITNEVFDQGNMLWKNLGGLRFANVAREQGVRDGGWGWGAKFFDFDNDTDLDLYTVNGFVSAGPVDLFRTPADIYRGNVSDLRSWPDMRGMSLSGYEPKRLFLNTGDQFTDIAPIAGLDSIVDARGVVLSDIEGDGDLDIFVSNVATTPTLYLNEVGQRRNWLAVDLVGMIGNRDGVGARLTASSGELRQIREVDGGNGYCGQSTRLVHFGLRDAQKVDTLEIRWPGGRKVKYHNLEAGVKYVIPEEEAPR